jgi:hypothetical protein
LSKRLFHTHLRQPALTALVVLLCWLAAACDIPMAYRPAPSRTLRDITTWRHYPQQIAVSRFKNETFIKNQSLERLMEGAFISTLSECRNIWLTSADSAESPQWLSLPPRDNADRVDSFALCQSAARLGFRAVATGALTGLRVKETRTGWWRWRKTRNLLQVQVNINVFDTVTAAKLLSRQETYELELDPADAEVLASQTASMVPGLAELLENVSTKAAESTCDILDHTRWMTVLTKTPAGDIQLPVGSDQRLKVGHRFEVFDASWVISGSDGEKYIVPGYSLGIIEITAVTARQAEARVISGDAIESGNIAVALP